MSINETKMRKKVGEEDKEAKERRKKQREKELTNFIELSPS
jgi:hypothetical protein